MGDALRDGADLARKEFALFSAELTSNASGIAKGAVMFLAASVFAVASLIWLTQAMVYGLDVVIESRWISALIVGGFLAVIAAILIAVGRRMISASRLVPRRTMTSLKQDGQLWSERAQTSSERNSA